MESVIAAGTAYNNVVNTRVDGFAGLRHLATRVVNALDSTDATAQMVKDARVFLRKISGQRASEIVEHVPPLDPPPVNNSVSQRSYDQLVEHFAALISLVASEPSYDPNEVDLQVINLEAYLAQL